MSELTEYFNKFAISQSSLRDWKELPPLTWHKTWVTKELSRRFKAATVVGSFLDCIMFTPNDTEKRFIISEIKLPSDKVRLIVDDTVKHVMQLNKNAKLIHEKGGPKVPMKAPSIEDKELIASLCIKHDHYKTKPDQGYNDVVKKGTEYFEFLKKTKGRQIITAEENLLATDLKKILLEDKVSRGFFDPKKGCEVIFQQKIFSEFEISGLESVNFLPTKGALDIIHFNHKRKEVREVDLKYTASPNAFLFWDTIKRFDYPTQHSFYDYLLRNWLKTYKNGEYADYAVMNPLNVVIDGELRTPYIYSYSDTDLYIKRYGIEGTHIRGWEDIVNDIAWHFDQGDWSRPKEHLKNGYLTVKMFSKR